MLACFKILQEFEHYYAGTQRIASKTCAERSRSIGAGFGGALVDIDVNVETINADVETIALDLVALLERSNTCAQIESGNVTLPEPILPRVEELRYTSISNFESDMYFYHTDHLGSSSWITDASGAVNQHLQYLPLRQAQGSAFGEDFIYQRNSSWAVPYTFSGKEKDSETGFSYFGARYYDSDVSVWLSVDPLADKYPSMSGFMYVVGNQVELVFFLPFILS
jgi:RHS repeat-associated protein